jgi:hypothetical protein
MAQAQGSQRRLAYVVESTYGTTPATPTMKQIDYVSFNGDLNTPEIMSQTIRPNRQMTGSRRGNISTNGDLSVELTPDNYDDFLEAFMQGTWATNVLKVGQTQRSFSIEDGYLDLAQYRVFTGCVFNKLSLEVKPDSYVTPTFSFMGSNTSAFTATPLSANPTSALAKDAFFHEGGTFKEGGTSVAYLSAIKLDIDNNVDANSALGTTGVRNMTSGKFVAKGTVTALFETVAFYNKFKNATDSSLQFTLVSGAQTLDFNLPKINYTSAKITGKGDAGITVEVSFTGEYDATAATTMTITRS